MKLHWIRENGPLVSIAAATLIALACGTNVGIKNRFKELVNPSVQYAYSAWAPQFARQLRLSSTQSNLIGTFGNLGMYACGLPAGILVDAKGPRWGVAIGIIAFAFGYFPIYKAYVAGPGSQGMPLLCLFSLFTGAGSASSFTAAIKVAALNYPLSRGTATAFPLAAFGLSAFLFSTIGAFGLRDDTSKLLLLLASGTVLFPVVAFPFLNVHPQPLYDRLSSQGPPDHSDSQLLHRTSSTDSGRRRFSDDLAAQSAASSPFLKDSEEDLKGQSEINNPDMSSRESHEASSLISKPPASDSEDYLPQKSIDLPDTDLDLPHLDIRGFALLPHTEFWQLFFMMGLLTGIGLMSINNIGNDAQALWKHYDDSVEDSFVQRRQNIHVCIISFGSFSGRLLSGIGSDVLVKKFHRSRFWCLFVSAFTFCVAQLCALLISDPYLLVLVSGLTGVAYGLLFGVFPSLVAHTFGVNGLSTNWGTMTLAPAITGNLFNLVYGSIYDSHSIINEKGQRECLEGLQCYGAAYWVTFSAAIAGGLVCLWSVWHENKIHKSHEKSKRWTDHERLA